MGRGTGPIPHPPQGRKSYKLNSLKGRRKRTQPQIWKSFPGTVLMLANRQKDKEVRLERESAKRLEREREWQEKTLACTILLFFFFSFEYFFFFYISAGGGANCSFLVCRRSIVYSNERWRSKEGKRIWYSRSFNAELMFFFFFPDVKYENVNLRTSTNFISSPIKVFGDSIVWWINSLTNRTNSWIENGFLNPQTCAWCSKETSCYGAWTRI